MTARPERHSRFYVNGNFVCGSGIFLPCGNNHRAPRFYRSIIFAPLVFPVMRIDKRAYGFKRAHRKFAAFSERAKLSAKRGCVVIFRKISAYKCPSAVRFQKFRVNVVPIFMVFKQFGKIVIVLNGDAFAAEIFKHIGDEFAAFGRSAHGKFKPFHPLSPKSPRAC